MIQLGLDLIAETFEGMEDQLRSSGYRRKKRVISRRDETFLITSFGTVTYHKTLFKNKETIPMAAGAEEQIYLSEEMFRAESKRLTEEQKYVERMTHRMPVLEAKRHTEFKKYIWEL